MRILFLAADIDLGRNRGDSLHTRNLARSLVRVGNEVTLVVGSGGESWSYEGLSIRKRAAGGDVEVIRDLLTVVGRVQPDVIYERRFSPKLSAAVSSLSKTPFVVEINGFPDEEARMQGRPPIGGVRSRIKGIARARLFRRASAIVAVTEGLRAAIVSRYGVDAAKAFVVPNGVDSDIFTPGDREQARRDLSIRTDPVVCFVGNLVRWQGLDSLLKALSLAGPAMLATIVGDGPDHDRLLRSAQDLGIAGQVRFEGDTPYTDVPRYLAASNACVAPFTGERNLSLGASPLKVFEYIASARPVVVSAIPGPRELIEEFGCGLVVPPDNPPALANALQAVVSGHNFADAAARASPVVRQEYSWDRTAEKVGDILSKALRG